MSAPPYSFGPGTILEEDEDGSSSNQGTPEDEKQGPLLDDEEDESGSYSPMEGAYPHHPSGLSRAVNRLTLDFGEGFEFGTTNSPDSPQSFQEILDIGSSGTLGNSGSSSSLPLKDEGERPTVL